MRRQDSNLRPPGYEAVSSTNRSHFGSDLCFLPPSAQRIFRCFRPALPAFFGFWVKSGSDTVRPHPLQQRFAVHRAGGDSKTDLDDLIISAVQPNTVDLQSRIDLRLSEKVRAENCSDFSHVVQSCGRIVHEFYGTIYANKENGKLESNKRMWLYEKIHISILGNRVSVTYSKEV